ncbi:hypothetical protein LOAG_07609 [Loa loa]|uniref:Uncharacterized protein n=1 Tax=Loa loa TaxID=7209 RepID=A0A1S0TVP6_LOALO|nr:hypothetical protein LOAG_07609 [Loa loa]EFO20882.1 hypothetical protein LOAG_07609 [Loa loa]
MKFRMMKNHKCNVETACKTSLRDENIKFISYRYQGPLIKHNQNLITLRKSKQFAAPTCAEFDWISINWLTFTYVTQIKFNDADGEEVRKPDFPAEYLLPLQIQV